MGAGPSMPTLQRWRRSGLPSPPASIRRGSRLAPRPNLCRSQPAHVLAVANRRPSANLSFMLLEIVPSGLGKAYVRIVPQSIRAGIAALTFSVAVAMFVLATPAKAITIIIDDALQPDGTVQVTIVRGQNVRLLQRGEAFLLGPFRSNFFQASTTPGVGGIRLVEPGTDITSDILTVTIEPIVPFDGQRTFLNFFSDPNLEGAGSTEGFTTIEETGGLQRVGVVVAGPPREDRLFRNSLGAALQLPDNIHIFVRSDVEVPGLVVGTGLPGLLLLACGGLLALRWHRRQIAA
jgi:hypothetical protein